MRIELRGTNLRFYEDMATDRSCGESRSDWRFIDEVSVEHMVKSLEKLITGKSKVEFV